MKGIKKNMPKKIDLTGQRFGRLLVLKEGDRIHTPNGRSHIAWLCQCDCGNIVNVRGDQLRAGNTVSCGCYHRDRTQQMGRAQKCDLIGQRFGRLVVKEDTNERTPSGDVIWLCQCDCGNMVKVIASNLKRKKEPTISCGCAKSKGEEKLTQIFITNQILFVAQKDFPTCINPETNRKLLFDFYLPEYDVLIEYDGEQHFFTRDNDLFDSAATKHRDEYKNQWCKQNNKKLIRIPYTDYEKLSYEYLQKKILEV